MATAAEARTPEVRQRQGTLVGAACGCRICGLRRGRAAVAASAASALRDAPWWRPSAGRARDWREVAASAFSPYAWGSFCWTIRDVHWPNHY